MNMYVIHVFIGSFSSHFLLFDVSSYFHLYICIYVFIIKKNLYE